MWCTFASDAACAGVQVFGVFTDDIEFDVAGLRDCAADIDCVVEGADPVSYYRISSTGTCGTGQAQAQRTVQAMAKIEET